MIYFLLDLQMNVYTFISNLYNILVIFTRRIHHSYNSQIVNLFVEMMDVYISLVKTHSYVSHLVLEAEKIRHLNQLYSVITYMFLINCQFVTNY
jgi:hypothetical protein